MKVVHNFILTLALSVDYSECSSQTSKSLGRKLDADFPSSSGEQHTPDEILPGRTSHRARSRSPVSTSPPIKILGYSLHELGYIRLIPKANHSLRFEFRKYVFPPEKCILLRVKNNCYVPVPNGEQIVLSSTRGDILAILEYPGYLRGIFRTQKKFPRVKMNMISGAVDDLTTDEISSCPVGKYHPIFPQNFHKYFGGHDSLQSGMNHGIEQDPGASSSDRRLSPEQAPPQEPLLRARSMSPPGRPPLEQALGIAIGQLGFVRLIRRTNQNQQFEFRRYVFPTDETIRMRINQVAHMFQPNREYMVLTTSRGEIFAVLDNTDTLRGIYRRAEGHPRIKINMINGQIDNLTQDEMRDCPVGKNHPILQNCFIITFGNYDSLNQERTPTSTRDPDSSPSAIQSSANWSPPQEPSLVIRPRSPPGGPPSHEVLGYSLAKLGYIRLIPQANQNQRFEFRRYVIPAEKSFRLLSSQNAYVPVPTREHIVLSTSNGEVFAILEYTGVLRGIYTSNRAHPRIKINMLSGAFEKMTADEMRDCRVGEYYRIFPRCFTKDVSTEDSLRHVYI